MCAPPSFRQASLRAAVSAFRSSRGRTPTPIVSSSSIKRGQPDRARGAICARGRLRVRRSAPGRLGGRYQDFGPLGQDLGRRAIRKGAARSLSEHGKHGGQICGGAQKRQLRRASGRAGESGAWCARCQCECGPYVCDPGRIGGPPVGLACTPSYSHRSPRRRSTRTPDLGVSGRSFAKSAQCWQSWAKRWRAAGGMASTSSRVSTSNSAAILSAIGTVGPSLAKP